MITDGAGPKDYDFAVDAIDKMLTKHGFPPGPDDMPAD